MDMFEAATLATYAYGLMGNRNVREYMNVFFDTYQHADMDYVNQRLSAWQEENDLEQRLKTPLPEVPTPYVEGK